MKVDLGDHSFFVVRTASNPLSELVNRLNQVKESSTEHYLPLLTEWLSRPWNQKGLLLASPDLYKAWQIQTQTLDLTSSIGKSLWRYMLRSYSRATPFGLYSGVGVGQLVDQNAIVFGPQPWWPVNRPDSTLLTIISQIMLSDELVRKQLRYWLNNSVYQIGREYRFSQVVIEPSNSKIVLTSLVASEELVLIVNYLKQINLCSYQELLELFALEERHEAELFINQLIDSQFLSSSVLMPVTGVGWETCLINLQKMISVTLPLFVDFETIINDLRKKQQTIDELLTIQRELERIHEMGQQEPSPYLGSMVQTDLVFTPTELSLDRGIIRQIAHQFLRLLPLLQYKDQGPIANFVRRFRERYQDELVDLLTVLDPEYGIGFHDISGVDAPLLNQIAFAAKDEKNLNKPTNLVKALYDRFMLTGEMNLTLTDQDIRPYLDELTDVQMPTSFYLFGELFQQRTSDLSNKAESFTKSTESKWLFSIYSGTTSSPTYLLGRFCQSDPNLTKHVQSMCAWEQEQYPDELLAEVVHAPPIPKRARNIVSRPVLRTYEIPYMSPGGTNSSQVIYLTDLRVRVTEAGTIQLYHKQTGQRIRPRLSTAHKISLGDDIYQFLGYVEQQETNRFGWRWGYLQDEPRLPRITYQNLILHSARWTINRQALKQLNALTFWQLSQLYKLPRFVQLVGVNYSLFLDLDVTPCQAILLEEIEKNDLVRLKEWLPAVYKPWLTDQNKEYVSELIVPLKGQKQTSSVVNQSSYLSALAQPIELGRNIFPGGEWLYYKVYLNELAADHFLVFKLLDFAGYLFEQEWCQEFFFIRYNDPNFHLRIRFLVNPICYTQLVEACNTFFTPDSQESLVHRFEIGTYQRELERYNPELMVECEHIFSQDSQMVLNYLSSKGELKTDIDRYAFAIGSVDKLLDDMRYTLEEKVKFCQRNQLSFWKEEGSSKAVKKSLNNLYRSYADSICLETQQYEAVYNNRTQVLQPTLDKINRFYLNKNGTANQHAFISSLIHMNINRLFSVQQRRHELVVYHFLMRQYESRVARSKRV